MFDDPHLATVAGWVGKTYAEMEALYPRGRGAAGWEPGSGCWSLVRAAFALRGVDLPEAYYLAVLDSRMFRTVFDPQPWDVVPISNHRLTIVTHVALYLGGPDSLIIHALEDAGVLAHPLHREPVYSRIARDEKRRLGFLRLRN